MTEPLDPETHAYLVGLKRQGVTLGLDRMFRFATALGHPQDRVPVVHVAGTNGKGSVAAMIEAILRAAGWRTGLYTSPHLVRLGERIQVNRAPLRTPELAAAVAELRPLVSRLVAEAGEPAQPSYFEFMTALAFWHFAQARCDIALVEVGVGGRLDATNIVNPEVSVITSIGLDHCELLGDTLTAIAREKAGIVKRGRPVVLGRLPGEAEAVVRAIAAARQAPVTGVRTAFPHAADLPPTNLPGAYQRLNAGTASLAARALGARWRVTDAVIARGLAAVAWEGRWQPTRVGGRTVIVDSSHNAEGAEALDRNLAALLAEARRAPIVVVGVLGEARARPLLEVICRHAAAIHLVVPRQSRACTHDELMRLLPKGCGIPVHRSSVGEVFPASNACLPGAAPEATVVVTGSIYLAGEVLARIEPERGPFEPELQDF